MKKIIIKAFVLPLLICCFFVGYYVKMGINAASNTYTASGFYRTDFTQGIAYEGPMQFATTLGYSPSVNSNSTVTNWKNITASSRVVFLHTHGLPGLFTLSTSADVTGNSISTMSFSNTPRLVYISACQTGAYSATNGSVGYNLVSKGVDAVVAFTTNVTASTNTNGIHRFNSIVAYKLVHSYTLSNSLSQALTQLYSESGSYWGANSYVVSGTSSITF